MRRVFMALLALFAVPVPSSAIALEGAAKAGPKISLSKEAEDGEEMIVATVTVGGKPLEKVGVSFSVQRTFGRLLLGREETLDDGTAAVPFPAGLPGDETGRIEVTAKMGATAEYEETVVSALLPGGAVVAREGGSFPDALWAPSSPRSLLVTWGILLAIVWGTYLFVMYQLFRIWKGGTDGT